MAVKALSAIKCVPSKSTAQCWKIKLDDTLTKHKGKGVEFHMKINDQFYKGNLNDKGESIMFTADKVTHDDVYFDLKILPDYDSFYDYRHKVYPWKAAKTIAQLIWGEDNDKMVTELGDGGGCATRLSYVINRMKDCKYTYPRLLNDEKLRQKWTDDATDNPVPGFKSHALSKRDYIGKDSYDPISGEISEPKEKASDKNKNFNYIVGAKRMTQYISATYPDAPLVQLGDTSKNVDAPFGFSDPDDAAFLCSGVWAEQGDGHVDISKGDQGMSDYKTGTSKTGRGKKRRKELIEVKYWKFTEVQPTGISSDPADGSQVICFKHILKKQPPIPAPPEPAKKNIEVNIDWSDLTQWW